MVIPVPPLKLTLLDTTSCRNRARLLMITQDLHKSQQTTTKARL
jgi:hypothetical protein